MHVMSFIGHKDEREELRDSIKRHVKPQGTGWKKAYLPFNVLLTTYEMCMRESSFLNRFHWKAVIVDEAHRLKNPKSVLYQEIAQFERDFSLLLTGTPVQNNLQELYSLLSFVAPDIFRMEAMEEFAEKYGDVSISSGKSSTMQGLLAPFLLRRVKSEVVVDLPQKTEAVIYTGMSELQKKYYKAILMKDADSFATEGPSKTRLMNILVQLRKLAEITVNDPEHYKEYTTDQGVEPEPFELGDHLVHASGKLTLIDRLLEFLKKRGHKVLLFSQMTRMLDIIQDYLGYRGYSYERLDGSVRGEERYLAIQNFNETEDTFIFLLSTRAGGQGLNLTSADTIIFVDSDFNPQNDLQAAARAHRIGQTRPVKVMRLVARSTVEEIILKRAQDKLELTSAIIEGGQFSGRSALNQLTDSSPKLTDILKFGLDKLFESDERISTQTIDFNEILGGTVNGEWINDEELRVDDALTRESKGTETEVSNMYVYEGRDYSKDPSEDDKAAFDRLVAATLTDLASGERTLRSEGRTSRTQSVGLPGWKRKLLAPEELEQRHVKRKEAAAKRAKLKELEELNKAEERRRKLGKLWKENNYNTMNVCFNEEDEEEEDDEELLNVDEGDEAHSRNVQYVRGDVTHPINTCSGDAIIVHCVDDSGKWGQGGLFSAISRRSPQPETCYELAGEMKDLSLGDAHLVPFDDRQSKENAHNYVALIVAQSRDRHYRLSPIKLLALSQGLQRVAQAAKNLQASVHLPRIGHSTPNFNWYGTERLVRKHLASKGIPTSIYYFPRGESSSSASSRPQPCPSSVPPVQRKEGKSADKTKSGKNGAAERTQRTNELPDFMTGVTVYFESVSEEEKKRLGRYVYAYNGEVVQFQSADVTHVIREGAVSKDTENESITQPGQKAVTTAWLIDCFKKGRLLDTGPYQYSLLARSQGRYVTSEHGSL